MDTKKVQAIVDWPAPSKVPELRSFLGLANYYRKFIEGYSKKTPSPIFSRRIRNGTGARRVKKPLTN